MNAQERRVEELEQREQSVIIAVSTDPGFQDRCEEARRIGARLIVVETDVPIKSFDH